jgi:hypothetical protein
MRRLNFAIALMIFLLGSAIQTSGRPVASNPQDPQSPERAESARLTAQVHELYKQGKTTTRFRWRSECWRSNKLRHRINQA